EPEAAAEAARLRDDWAAHVASPPAGAGSLAAFTDEEDNLLLERAVPAAELHAAEMRPREVAAGAMTTQSIVGTTQENCRSWWFFGWHRACDTVERGRISDDSRQAHVPYQTPAFTLPRCVVGGDVAKVRQGCGPAAMTALVWRAWQDGADLPALRGFDRSSFASISSSYPTRRGAPATFENGMEFLLGSAF